MVQFRPGLANWENSISISLNIQDSYEGRDMQKIQIKKDDYLHDMYYGWRNALHLYPRGI